MNTLRYGVLSSSLCKRLCQNPVAVSAVRHLYNEQFLGIDKYVEGRQRTISRLGNMKENFYNRMFQQLNSKSPSMVFTEDLKTIIHSCEDDSAEIDVCTGMIKKFHKQNKELRFGTFIFGPVAMRLFYYLQKRDIMHDFFTDPELLGFFDQLKSYLLYMDLCFKNGMYKEILDAYVQLSEKQLAETKYPREALVLTTAACFKLNTPETYQLATSLITGARESHAPVIRKALTFVVAHALNQNRFDVALELLSSIERFNNITGNNLKLIAMAGLDRIQDAFSILRRVTDQDSPTQAKIRGEVCQCSLDAVQQSVERINDQETNHIFEQLSRSLKESNLISNQTVDDLVCTPIEPRLFFRDLRDSGAVRQRGQFPDSPFRAREREMGDRERDDDFPVRRRQFGGIKDEY